MMHTNDIINLIKSALPDALVEIEDLRGDGEHYAAYVESEAFEGKPRVEQHRMVFKALQGHIGTSLQTLTLKTVAPSSAYAAAS